jgi:hypothetical protein
MGADLKQGMLASHVLAQGFMDVITFLNVMVANKQ